MSRKIKILHIQETIGSGGVERRRLSLAKYLDKNIFEQRIICCHSAGNIVEEIIKEEVKVDIIGNLNSPIHWSQHKKVQKIIEEYKPDIIHGAVFEGVTMAAINGCYKKVPIVIIEETSDPKNRTWKGDLLMRFFSKLSDKVIGVSEGVTQEYLKDKLKLSSSKAITISNGVSMPRIVSDKEIIEAKEKLGINKNDLVIGSVGRMADDEHKRYSDLLRSFAEISKKNNFVKLLLIGQGPLLNYYKELSQKLGISNRVIFLGYQSDVSLYYKLMDIFTLVSAREAFGLVLAEAMLSELPVVATKVGGMKYIVDDRKTGFLVEPKNIVEITERLEKLLGNPELRHQMGINGFEKAKKNYLEEMYVKKIHDLYINCLKSKGITT